MKDPNAVVSTAEFERLVSERILDRQLNTLPDQALAQIRMVILEHLPPDDREVTAHQAFLSRSAIKRAAEHYRQIAAGQLVGEKLTADESYHVLEYARELGLNMPPTMETKNVLDI